MTIKIGDIFYESWGYDQTNVDFYEVVKVISDKTIEVSHIASIQHDDSHVTADKGVFIDSPQRKRINKYGNIKCTGYGTARLWDGSPKYCTPFVCGH